MTSILHRGLSWWRGRTGRERLLLGLLAAAISATAFWYGVVTPLNGLAETAAERRRLAVAEASEAEALAAELARTGPSAGGDQGRDLEGPVEAAATSKGLVVARRQAGPGGGLAVWLEPASPRAVFDWIGVLHQEHGLGVGSLEMHRVGAGEVETRAAFVRRPT